MQKAYDPRFWGKVAASGGIKPEDLPVEALDELMRVEVAKKRLANGATVCQPKGARGFKSLRLVKTEATLALGQAILSR